MHRRHFCSYSNQQVVGRCCDCTHWCYTPQFWDVFFRDMRLALVADFVPPLLPAAAGAADGGLPRRAVGVPAYSRPARARRSRRWAEMRP